MCSNTGAIATGSIYRNGAQLKCVIVSNFTGNENQEAATTPEKSTLPIHKATIYPTTTPEIRGTSFISPLPKVSTSMAVNSELKASNQSDFAMFTAVSESERPIRIMTGPITTGGKIRLRSFLPCHFIRALMPK